MSAHGFHPSNVDTVAPLWLFKPPYGTDGFILMAPHLLRRSVLRILSSAWNPALVLCGSLTTSLSLSLSFLPHGPSLVSWWRTEESNINSLPPPALPPLCPQPPTSGSSRPSEATSPPAVPPTALCAMGRGCWCSEGWWSTANTATICTSCRSVTSRGCRFRCGEHGGGRPRGSPMVFSPPPPHAHARTSRRAAGNGSG